MNTKLSTLLNWAEYHGIDLDRAALIHSEYSWDTEKFDYQITFDHAKENREQFQAVKKAIGNFPQEGTLDPDTVPELKKTITHKDKRIQIVWSGAFECEISRRCHFKGFDQVA